MEIVAKYYFTYDLFVRCNNLHAKRIRSAKIWWAVFYIVFPLICLGAAACALWVQFHDHDAHAASGLWIISGVFAFYCALSWGGRAWRTRKAFQGSFSAAMQQSENIIRISDAAIESQIGTLGNVHLTWDAFCRREEGDGLTLIYLTKTRFHCIPHNVLTPDEVSALHTLVEKHIGDKKC